MGKSWAVKAAKEALSSYSPLIVTEHDLREEISSTLCRDQVRISVEDRIEIHHKVLELLIERTRTASTKIVLYDGHLFHDFIDVSRDAPLRSFWYGAPLDPLLEFLRGVILVDLPYEDILKRRAVHRPWDIYTLSEYQLEQGLNYALLQRLLERGVLVSAISPQSAPEHAIEVIQGVATALLGEGGSCYVK